jgi:HEAT repeat protein/beta-lactamase regulating signal transducer with metallopeptidase domain
MSLSALFSNVSSGAIPWLPIADAIAKASLLLGVAALATTLLHRTSAATRHLIWTIALVSALSVPVLSFALPHWQVPVFEVPPSATDTIATPPDATPLAHARRLSSGATPSERPAASATASPTPSPSAAPRNTAAINVSWQSLAVGIWLGGFLLVIGRMLAGMIAVLWMSRRTEVIIDAPWLPVARRLAAGLGVSPRLLFLRSPRATMPMAWGVLHQAVLVPADTDDWPLERLRIVLLHELAHVRRRDCLTHLLAQATCAVYWFNPLAWMASRRARAERERACDDLVLAAGTRGSDYAEELLEIARVMKSGRFPAVLAGATLAMAHRSQLEGRLLAILDPKVPRSGVTRLRMLAASVVCACAVMPLAAVQPWTSQPTERRGDAAVPDLSSLQMPNLPGPKTKAAQSPASSSSTTTKPHPSGSFAAGDAQGVVQADAHATAVAQSVAQGVAAGVAASATSAVEGVVSGMAFPRIQVTPQPNPQPTPNPEPSAGGNRRADPRTVAALTAALKDSDKEVRETAMHALVQMRDPSIYEPLVLALRDESADVREQAAYGLGQLHDPRAVDGLTTALKDTDADVREQAAFALGQIRDRRASLALGSAITDANDSVREQAVFALGQLRDPAAVDALVTALHDPKPKVREQAAFALGQIRDRKAVDPLTAALKDANADVREQAAFALGQIRDRAAVEALVIALKDSVSDVREQAAFALGQLRDPRAIDGLTAALKDTDASVRQQAAFALGQVAR